MEISGVALQSKLTGSPSPQSGSSAEIQKLEQQKKDLQQQIRQLEQGKQGGDAVKNRRDKLQKQMQEIDKQIQVLKQQGTQETQKTAEVQPTEEDVKVPLPRFDEYVNNHQESSSAGIYSVEQDENGNPLIVFDRPERPPAKQAQTIKEP